MKSLILTLGIFLVYFSVNGQNKSSTKTQTVLTVNWEDNTLIIGENSKLIDCKNCILVGDNQTVSGLLLDENELYWNVNFNNNVLNSMPLVKSELYFFFSKLGSVMDTPESRTELFQRVLKLSR